MYVSCWALGLQTPQAAWAVKAALGSPLLEPGTARRSGSEPHWPISNYSFVVFSKVEILEGPQGALLKGL